MVITRRYFVLGAALALYLVVLAFLGGMALDRFRFSARREAVLHEYDDGLRRWHEYLMRIEQEASVADSSLDDRNSNSSSDDGILLPGPFRPELPPLP